MDEHQVSDILFSDMLCVQMYLCRLCMSTPSGIVVRAQNEDPWAGTVLGPPYRASTYGGQCHGRCFTHSGV